MGWIARAFVGRLDLIAKVHGSRLLEGSSNSIDLVRPKRPRTNPRARPLTGFGCRDRVSSGSREPITR